MSGDDLHAELEGAIADARRLQDELGRFEHLPEDPAPRRPRRVLLLISVALLLAVAVAVGAAVLRPAGSGTGTSGGATGSAASGGTAAAAAGAGGAGCAPLRVTAAAVIAPVIQRVAAGLADGPDCVQVQVETADGRQAGSRALLGRADVWVPDDPAWAATAPDGLLAERPPAAAAVLATSPVLLVTDPVSGRAVTRAGGGWAGLERLAAGGRLRIVSPDPQGSADGLLAIGGLGEVVWIADGMDASAAALVDLRRVTRTVRPAGQALALSAGEVALLPEYRLAASPAPAADVVLAPSDRTALLRFSWLPTRAGAADPERRAAADRLLQAVSGAEGQRALAAAGLRGPTGRPLPGAAATPGQLAPAALSPALDVLEPHHVDHVLATWYPQDRTVDLLVVVDVSGSMADRPPGGGSALITVVKQGCRSLARLLPDQARLGLWEFGAGLDGPRDYRRLVDPAPLTRAHRDDLDRAVGGLYAKRTNTGLYDTVLAAYKDAVGRATPGLPTQVVVFTDGDNEGDPNSITAAELARQLTTVAAGSRIPVSLGVMAFGDQKGAATLEQALKPVGGYVDRVGSAAEVDEAFLHLAAGGLHS